MLKVVGVLSHCEFTEQLCEPHHHIQEYYWSQCFQLFLIISCVGTIIEAFPVFFHVKQLDFDTLLCTSILHPIKNPDLSTGPQYIQHAGSFEIQHAGSLFI